MGYGVVGGEIKKGGTGPCLSEFKLHTILDFHGMEEEHPRLSQAGDWTGPGDRQEFDSWFVLPCVALALSWMLLQKLFQPLSRLAISHKKQRDSSIVHFHLK